jgi:DNA-binding response OmpR family regulator
MAAVLLIGFDSGLEASLYRALNNQGHSIQTARTAAAALRISGQAMPALILLDTDLPADAAEPPLQDGFALCNLIRAQPGGAEALIAFITHRDATADRLSGFVAGADDYIVIPFQMPELVLRANAWLRRVAVSAPVESAWLRFGPLVLDCNTGDLWIAERHERLTPVEVRLLCYLISCPGRPVSAEELLRHVWRQDPGTGDPVLVRVHMRNLRAKLEADPAAPSLLLTSPRQGYYLAPEPNHGPTD